MALMLLGLLLGSPLPLIRVFERVQSLFCQFFFYCSGSCTLLFIAASRTAIDFRALTPQAMQCLRQSYPWNYVPRG